MFRSEIFILLTVPKKILIVLSSIFDSDWGPCSLYPYYLIMYTSWTWADLFMASQAETLGNTYN